MFVVMISWFILDNSDSLNIVKLEQRTVVFYEQRGVVKEFLIANIYTSFRMS